MFIQVKFNPQSNIYTYETEREVKVTDLVMTKLEGILSLALVIAVSEERPESDYTGPLKDVAGVFEAVEGNTLVEVQIGVRFQDYYAPEGIKVGTKVAVVYMEEGRVGTVVGTAEVKLMSFLSQSIIAQEI